MTARLRFSEEPEQRTFKVESFIVLRENKEVGLEDLQAGKDGIAGEAEEPLSMVASIVNLTDRKKEREKIGRLVKQSNLKRGCWRFGLVVVAGGW